MANSTISDRSYVTAALLSIFLGGLGVDRFYVGHIWLGVIKLITGGGFGVWYLIDLVLFVTGSVKDSNGRELAGIQSNRRTIMMIVGGLVIVGCFSTVVGLVAFRSAANNATSSETTEVHKESPAQSVRVSRTVAGWTYTVDAAKEQELFMEVKTNTDGTGILNINGRGCNSASATVADQPADGARSRVIAGKTYYLYPGTQTAMACDGEKADSDALVQQEIDLIFDSLSRD
jgi:TM2 domain-containing membrane protein YozV